MGSRIPGYHSRLKAGKYVSELTLELIVLPHGADLDQVGAARCLLLLRPETRLLRPNRVSENAWQLLRRADWFFPVPLAQVQWAQVKVVHLLGLTQVQQNPRVLGLLPRLNAEVFVYSHSSPKLPVKAQSVPLKSGSLTSHFIGEIRRLGIKIEPDDASLLASAIAERTWCGLAQRTSPLDLESLQFLRTFPVVSKQIGNQVCLGLREGQKGLLNDLLLQATDEQIGNWPVVVSVAQTNGNVQDLLPVIDRLWSRLDSHILVVGVCYSGRSRVFARSRLPGTPMLPCFRSFQAREEDSWVSFSLKQSDPCALHSALVEVMKENLKPDTIAREIMAASPRTILAQETVANAHDMMLRFNLMSLLVTRQDRYVGLITRRDLDRAVQMDLWDSPINPFVPSTRPWVTPDTPVCVLRSLMVRHNVTKLPVVENGSVVGIITSRELLRALHDPLPLPRLFLPLVETTDLPEPLEIETMMKQLVPPRVLDILKRIGAKAEKAGRQAFLVGGFVRDLLLEKPNLDMDIVMIGDALPFVESLQEEFTAEPCHFERFHTARLAIDGVKIDFSSARIEHYSQPAALPHVELSGLSNDLFRRDFSINALALDILPGRFLRLIDFFGGYRDLREKKIRILHSFSFLEDPTRLYRAVRFAGRFHFTMDPDTQQAFDLALQRDVVSRLSPKRIGAEIARCLREEIPHRVLQKLFAMKLVRALHPALHDYAMLPVRFRLIPAMIRRFQAIGEPIDGEAIHWIGLLAPLSATEADKLLMDLHFPAGKRRIVVETLRQMPDLPQNLARIAPGDDAGLYILLKGFTLEGLISLIAFDLDKGGARRVIDYLGRLRLVKSELSGNDLIALGIPPGPHMRAIFQDLLMKRIRGEVASRKDEEEYVRQNANIYLSPAR